MKLCHVAALAGVSISALCIPVAASAQAQDQAQSAQTEAALDSGEIIVQARRRSESIQDVPLVVNAVTADQVQKLNIRNFTDVQTLVPGLQLRVEPNGVGGSGQLRGISYSGNSGANPSVAFYQNDAIIEPSNLLQAMYDIGDIEVLRGPQGTLRGQASPSGSITATTRKPDLYQAGATLTATANDIGTQNINGAIGLPIVKGIAAIRVAGLFDQGDGNRVKTIAAPDPYGKTDLRDPFGKTKSGRVSLLVTPADWLRLEGVYQHTYHRTRSFNQYESYDLLDPSAAAADPAITAGDRRSIQENPNLTRQTYDVYNWRAELRHWGQVLIYQGSRSIEDFHAHTNSDSGNFVVNQAYFQDNDLPANFYQDTRSHSKSMTHEIRLQNEERVAGIFDYVIGYYSTSLSPQTHLTTQTPVFLPAAYGGGLTAIASTPIVITSLGKTTERSEFGNITAHLGGGTELSGGVRHIASRAAGSILSIAGNGLVNPTKKDKGWIYTASIKHNFNEDLMIYASTGTSRRPGPNIIGDFSVMQSALEQAFTHLPTETSKSYEIGIKSSWLDKRLRFNLTAYHQTFKNYAYYNRAGAYFVNYAATVAPGGAVTVTPGVSLSSAFVAPVPVTVNGVEGELSFDVTPRWNIDVVGSYSLGKIKKGIVPCTDINGDGIPDSLSSPPTLTQLQAATGANNLSTCRVTQRSSEQPPFSATVTSEYSHPVSAHTDMFLRGLLSLYGNSRGDPVYAFDGYKGYGLLNLFVGARDADGMWELTFFAKNVTGLNKVTNVITGGPAQTSYQRLSTSFVPSAQTYTSNYAQIETTPPREFGVTFRVAFGAK